MAAANQNNTSRPAPRKRRKSRVRRVFGLIGKILGTMILIGICTGALLVCFAAVYIKTVIIPEADMVLSSINLLDLSQSSTMYYTDKNTGELVEMLTLYGEENRVWVEYKDIPENMVNATIAIEDQRFLQHNGVDWYRTAGAIFYMFTGADIQGGSTITQQMIKNVTGENEVTVKRKVREIFSALEYEKTHSKEDIMEWYLNYIYLGSGCYGISTAAMNYFGKEVQDLSLAECASLIAITNSPTKYNPYLYPENNLERRNLVLYLMYDQGKISEAEYNAATAEKLALVRSEGSVVQEQDVFTWYEDQVINDVIEGLCDQHNLSKEAATRMIYQGGLHIETCFDPEVQAYVDAVYNDRSSLVLDSKTGQEIQSGITIIDNTTGNVVALAGGIGEKDSSRIFSRATDTVRPPGSSIKPLAVYAPALDMGMITPATVFDDTPINLNGSAWPVNAYGYYKGLTTVHEALEDSVNTIAVKVLRDCVTPQVSYQFMVENFGITTLKAYMEVNGETFSDIDLGPLALGGLTQGVSTYEMAAAYASFANNGMYKEPHTYLRVTRVSTDGKETVLLENTSSGTAIMKESTAYYMNTMLKNVIQNGTGHDANFSGMTIAGKTGTTTSNKDKWFVGYSPYYTAAVWVGYDRQERMNSSGYLAAQMWRKVMQPLHENLENKSFYTPEGLVAVSYCKDSGMLATPACSADPRGGRVTQGYFASGDQPTEYCTVHSSIEVCVDSPVLDANGVPTGAYNLAGAFCPAESRRTVSGLVYDRERVNSSIVTRDDAYLIGSLSNRGVCTVHTSASSEKPVEFDPTNPETWPTNDPNFDPENPTTWPGYEHNGEDPPEVSEPPTVSDPPVVDPTPPVDPTQDPSPEPTVDPEPPPTDEPYIPVEAE